MNKTLWTGISKIFYKSRISSNISTFQNYNINTQNLRIARNNENYLILKASFSKRIVIKSTTGKNKNNNEEEWQWDDEEEETKSKPTTNIEMSEDDILENVLTTNIPIPADLVKMLSKHVVGQNEALKAMAIAVRNRWRRTQVPKDLSSAITPKHILMEGPTGVGKSEIVRRLADIYGAPFVRVTMTSYTQLGFVGGSVSDIIDSLIAESIRLTKQRLYDNLSKKLRPEAVESVSSMETDDRDRVLVKRSIVNSNTPETPQINAPPGIGEAVDKLQFLVLGQDREDNSKVPMDFEKAVEAVIHHKISSSIKEDTIIRASIRNAEEHGIVILDELDKTVRGNKGSTSVVSGNRSLSPDEGVQRDLLPLLEGSTLNTKYGSVKTNSMLFIGAGAFSSSKPEDLLQELQGRLPIRVKLNPLNLDALHSILSEPEHSLLKQAIALIKTEGITLSFSRDAVVEMAKVAFDANSFVDDLGARRLVQVAEKVVEDLMFEPPKSGSHVKITSKMVQKATENLLKGNREVLAKAII